MEANFSETITSPRPLTGAELEHVLGVALPATVRGDTFRGLAPLVTAGGDQVSFLHRRHMVEEAKASRAGMLLHPRRIGFDHPRAVAVDDVWEAVIRLLEYLHPAPPAEAWRHDSAVVDPSASIGAEVYLGANVVVGEGARIGEGTRIEANTVIGRGIVVGSGCWLSPGVVLLEGTEIGNRVRLHSGVVIGADGFRYEMIGRRITKVPQVGRVVVEDDVEIGANTTVDRAFLAETRIGARTKIDNLVQVGHNVVIGSDCIIVAQVGLAGSVRLGRGVQIGGRSAVKDHVAIGDGARIAGASVVGEDVPPGMSVIGVPAVSARTYTQFVRFYRGFDSIWKRLKPVLGHESGTE